MAEINKQVGKVIQRLRKSKGLTQKQLAERTRLHHAYIGHIERGEKNIGLINLEKIAKGLGVPIILLISAAEEQSADGN